jgi:hypothetical protein
MTRETFMICDVCKKRVLEGTAYGWIAVSPANGSSFALSGNYLKPVLFGLYCSCSCLKNRINEIDDFETNPLEIMALKLDAESEKL